MKSTPDTESRCEKQESIIERHLKTIGSITPRKAVIRYDIYRLAAVIFRLKNRRVKPLNIETTVVHEHPIQFARYKLIRNKKAD